MRAVVIALALLAGCNHNHSDDIARGYLMALGYKDVQCHNDVSTVAWCIADGARFRCVSNMQDGYGGQTTTACEGVAPIGATSADKDREHALGLTTFEISTPAEAEHDAATSSPQRGNANTDPAPSAPRR